MNAPGTTPKRSYDIQTEKIIWESEGQTYLSVNVRLPGTSLFVGSIRNVLDVPVHILENASDHDWSDPLLQEMRREALDDIECQAHVIARAFGIGQESRPSWQEQQAQHLRAVEAALGLRESA